MNKIRQILRLFDQGRSKQSIAVQTGVSRNTAKKYLSAFISSGFSYEEVNLLGDRELEDLFGKSNEPQPDSRLQALQKRFPQMDKELKRTGVTRKILWESHLKDHPDGLQYTQFCFYYNQWKARVNPVMHIDHKAGDKPPCSIDLVKILVTKHPDITKKKSTQIKPAGRKLEYK
nr:helix-turn-helix domain-containing protein [Sphingobacterium humi]